MDLELGNRLIKEAEVFKEELSVLEKERAVLAEKIKEHEEKLTKKNSYEKAKRALVKKADVAKELETLTYGRKFLEFVSDEYLKEITVSASRTLLKLTHGKYALIYEEEFFVGDNDFGGARRSVRTLSGGEIFMVSLSLALSLSTAIYLKANKPIEFFFLDEGFGTLDEKKTDEVLSSLEKLKNSDFSIGLISHVKELKERITAKIIVNAATPDRGTTVSVEI